MYGNFLMIHPIAKSSWALAKLNVKAVLTKNEDNQRFALAINLKLWCDICDHSIEIKPIHWIFFFFLSLILYFVYPSLSFDVFVYFFVIIIKLKNSKSKHHQNSFSVYH